MDVETPPSNSRRQSPNEKRPREKFVTLASRVIAVSSFLACLVLLIMDPYFIFSWIPVLARPLDLGTQQDVTEEEQFRTFISGIQVQDGLLNSTNSSNIKPRDNDDYFIANFGIRGKEAVEQFKAHLDCWSDGNWIHDPTPRRIPWVATPDKLHFFKRCDNVKKATGGVYGAEADSIALSNDSNAAGNWSVREELKWKWVTDETKCLWHRVDRDEFCRKIGSNGNILIIGDSISELAFNAVVNGLAKIDYSNDSQLINPGDELCADVLGGQGKGFTVEFVRNDYLSLRSDKLWDMMGNRESPWMPILQDGKKDFKILLMNRGAHFMPDLQYTEGLRETFTFLRAWFPELIVIFRNTPSGHINCTDHHKPIAKPSKGAPPGYHWEDFDRQNQLAKSIVEEFHYIYLDVATAIGMRPEGHFSREDCLHYCLPGPLDLVVEMFYNLLHVFGPI